MKTCTASLQSATGSPYSQGKHITEDKKPRELPKDYEVRNWRHRLHVNEAGNVIIPPMSLKNCLSEAAKFLSISIPGKGKSLYTKHFEAGVMVTEPVVLDIKATDVEGEWLFVPSDGKRGGGKRVDKRFPKIEKWAGDVVYFILDEIITKDVFQQVLNGAGQFIGLGRFRPACNGYYGRFNVTNLQWNEN